MGNCRTFRSIQTRNIWSIYYEMRQNGLWSWLAWIVARKLFSNEVKFEDLSLLATTIAAVGAPITAIQVSRRSVKTPSTNLPYFYGSGEGSIPHGSALTKTQETTPVLSAPVTKITGALVRVARE